MMRPSFLATAIVVFVKESVDGLRDWRSVLSALIYPVLGPVMVTIIVGFAVDHATMEEHVDLPTQGAERAPELLAYLASEGIHAVPAPDEPRAAVKRGDLDLVLVIPEDFRHDLARAELAHVDLIQDASRTRGAATRQRVQIALQTWAQKIGALRLMARGISQGLATPMLVNRVEVSSERKRVTMILGVIPLFVILAAFVCGMQLSMDVTAGERERGSLEPLLLNPSPRGALVLGKWAAASLFALIGVALTLGGSLAVLPLLPLDAIGMSIVLKPIEIVGLFAAILPLAFAASGLQMLLSTFARSVKEAQAYLSLLILAPTMPLVYAMLYPMRPDMNLIPIPVLGQQLLLSAVLSAEPVSPWAFLLAGISSLAIGLIAVWLTALLFRREAIVFGR
jgi:sodium transport system permease protein